MVLYVYRYSKEEVAKLREAIIHNCIKPIVKKFFENHPQLNSAMLLVAQYYNDEASDAVHEFIFFSVLENPDFEAFSEAELHPDGLDRINLPELSHLMLMRSQYAIKQSLKNEIHDEAQIAERSYDWDSNGEAIPAFAAFCKEGCHQEMMLSESYSPCAILRRRGEEIEVEVIGQMLRPWLDGFQECEDILSEQQAADWREGIFLGNVVPVFKIIFDKYPQLNSAILLVAQYWENEANDAVRERLLFSVPEPLDVDAVLKLDSQAVWKNKHQSGTVNLSELQIELYENENDESSWEKIDWEDRGKALASFAGWCKGFCYDRMRVSEAELASFYKEDCDRQMSILEAYSPYAILRRKGEGIEVEIIGEKLRSQLNGIKPEERSE